MARAIEVERATVAMRRAARSLLDRLRGVLETVFGTPGDGKRNLFSGLWWGGGSLHVSGRARETQMLVHMEEDRMRAEEERHDDPAP